ncbi:MurR/RpiR family transcriptional regulator [Anaerococcus hydrogenalis]|uniref:MurR/RpiR family transcriptional regulator n=1 Tax=Anaerococcus hydrogenalis TaxID=33029 RepID=UPI0023F369C3|nr:MurR/RpiR family transcriptional regulator [Anaerococcus hydrogenalis]
MTPVKNKIFSSYNDLYEAERKVADFIINNWDESMDSTIVDLADKIKVSEATIIRFCKKIGMNGFHELKIRMAKESYTHEKNNSYTSTLNIDNIDQSILNMKNTKIEEINETFNNLKSQEIKEIINLITSSKIVEFAAMGNTIPIALNGSYKFNQIGIRSFTSTIWESQISFSKSLTKDDLLIAISDSGESKNLLTISKIAKKAGTKIIAIIGKKNSSLSKYADYIIETFSREIIFHDWISFTRVSAMSIIDFLFLMIVNSDDVYFNKLTEHEENISGDKN